MKLKKTFTLNSIALVLATGFAAPAMSADTIYEALSSGKAYGNFNLRGEHVSQDNALDDASAFTLRTRLGYKSGDFNGWSFTAEMEDSRIVLGQGDYTVGPAGYNVGDYSVIADPETTELDQGFIQYKNDDFTFKLGRQVVTLDGHRFVGHVGWRQDRQTFDAATVLYHPNEKLKLSYSFLAQRNRIFAEAADLDSKDHLFNASYKTEIGKFVAYTYLLEVDNSTNNSLDTYGLSYSGGTTAADIKWTYYLEAALQSSQSGGTTYDTNYLHASVGGTLEGYTLNLGYERLGSDNGNAGFATPLATLHKFNGWADIFLATPAEGLQDLNVSLKTKALGGNLTVAYHQYEADEASATVDDLGSEVNFSYVTKVFKNYGLGLKYASYKGDSGRPDTDKVWLWVNTSF